MAPRNPRNFVLPDTPDDLNNVLIQGRHFLRQKALEKCPDPFAVIKGQEAAKRVILVAGVRQQPILFVGPKDSGKSMLVRAANAVGVPARELRTPTRELGGLASEMKRATAQWNKQFNKALQGIELLCEAPTAPARVLLGPANGTNLAWVQEQLQKAHSRPLPKATAETLDDECKALLKQALIELNLPPGAVANIVTTARAIAALDGADTVQVQHVAEAVQYDPTRYAS